ncbi:MAG: hypothetical protein H7145_06685 [Akkermansiaceae bacterium]|nr:hypothetical protein [Armatimonadota bacterium]
MEPDDATFLRAFESCSLPRSEWTHRAHLRMAYLYLCDFPDAEELLPVIRRRIQTYNTANRNRSGYHETITAAYLYFVADRLRHRRSPDFAGFERENADLFAPGGAVLLQYYRGETLFSPEARARFISPDRTPLPQTKIQAV